MTGELRLFFATDVHGSDVCWKKFVNAGRHYRADTLILGGDLTGKAVVPLVKGPNGSYTVTLMEQEATLQGEAETEAMEKRIAAKGYYPVRLTPEEIAEYGAHREQVEELFSRCVLSRLEEWLDFAERKLAGTAIRCFVAPGNDDPPLVDGLLEQSSVVTVAEGQVLPLDDVHMMISTGWTNHTPWHTYRESDEEELAQRIEAMAKRVADPNRCVFNLHCPPYKSGLDDAPDLDEQLRPRNAGRSSVPAGSHAVRQVIERYQPPLGLFGHIHEARGSARIGRTLAINPGSAYESGTLQGALVELRQGKVERYLLTTG